jgi:hypothetical protein
MEVFPLQFSYRCLESRYSYTSFPQSAITFFHVYAFREIDGWAIGIKSKPPELIDYHIREWIINEANLYRQKIQNLAENH